MSSERDPRSAQEDAPVVISMPVPGKHPLFGVGVFFFIFFAFENITDIFYLYEMRKPYLQATHSTIALKELYHAT